MINFVGTGRRFAVLALASVLVSSAACASSHEPGPQLPNRPTSIMVKGVRLQLVTHQGGGEPVLTDAHDPRLLRLSYAQPINGPQFTASDPCPVLSDPFAYIDHEDAHQVTVDIAGYEKPLRGSGLRSCATETGARILLPVRLKKPLGTRVVYDQFKSRAEVVTESSVPVPAYIPAGFGPGTLGVNSLNDAERTYVDGKNVLSVVVEGVADPPSLTPSNAVVNGHPAKTEVDDDFRSIEWAVSGHHYAVFVQPVNDDTHYDYGDPFLSEAELVKIADSIT